MPAIKAQFNASTLKASYLAANDTAQVLNPYGTSCSDCPVPAETVEFLTATFSGITTDCGCADRGGTDFTWVFNFDPNQAFTLTQVAACQWQYTITNGVTYIWYQPGGSGNCDAPPSAPANTNVIIDAYRQGDNTIDIFMHCVWHGGATEYAFAADNITADSACMNAANISNEITDCGFVYGPPAGTDGIAYDGQVTIAEVG
jgi:hypothetical protein